MKKLLLAGALLFIVPSAAQAQVTAICPTCSQFVNQVMDDAKVISQQLQQLQQLQMQYEMLTNVYNTLTHVTSVGGAVSALGMLGISNPLPVNPWAVQSLVNGSGTSIGGLSASLNGMFNQSWNTNHVYTPTGTYASQYTTNANSIAGIQGLSQQLYQGMAQRIPLIQNLYAQYGSSSDPKAIADLQARLLEEQTIIQSQQAQAQALGIMASTSQRGLDEQQQELRQQNIDTVLSSDPG